MNGDQENEQECATPRKIPLLPKVVFYFVYLGFIIKGCFYFCFPGVISSLYYRHLVQ